MEKEKIWLKHYPEEIPTSITYDEKPLHAFLEEAANTYKEKNASYFTGKEFSVDDVYSASQKLANSVQSLWPETGDRVSIMLPNSPQAVTGYYGALMAGGVVVQTNPSYKELELEYHLTDS